VHVCDPRDWAATAGGPVVAPSWKGVAGERLSREFGLQSQLWTQQPASMAALSRISPTTRLRTKTCRETARRAPLQLALEHTWPEKEAASSTSAQRRPHGPPSRDSSCAWTASLDRGVCGAASRATSRAASPSRPRGIRRSSDQHEPKTPPTPASDGSSSQQGCKQAIGARSNSAIGKCETLGCRASQVVNNGKSNARPPLFPHPRDRESVSLPRRGVGKVRGQG